MDNAVALVQAYLRVNGYFTVSEFPIIELRRREGYRTATDLDILAFRFPGAGKLVANRRGTRAGSEARFAPDPELGVPPQQPDMIIGEVKEGRAVLNAATTDPAVLKVVLARFGCCSRAEAPRFAEELLRAGATILPAGHRVRLMAFGSIADPAAGGAYQRMALGHVVRFLQSYLREHWALLRHEDSKDSLAPPVCIGVHAVFAEGAYEELLGRGAARVVTCNTIPHPSNAIDLAPRIAAAARRLMGSGV